MAKSYCNFYKRAYTGQLYNFLVLDRKQVIKLCVQENWTSDQACQQLGNSKCLNSKKAHRVIIFCCSTCVHPYLWHYIENNDFTACIIFSLCKVAGRKYGRIIIEGLNCPYKMLHLTWTVITFWMKSNYYTSAWVFLVKCNSLWNYHQWEWFLFYFLGGVVLGKLTSIIFIFFIYLCTGALKFFFFTVSFISFC